MEKVVKIEKGRGGWGGPLFLKCEGKRNKVLSMTGGGIHEVAQYIADQIGAEAVDGFEESPKDEEIVCAVINCGGTLRCGIYPQKNIFTINLNTVGPAGPLAEHIVEELYVSGVRIENIKVVEQDEMTQDIPTESIKKREHQRDYTEDLGEEYKTSNKEKENVLFTLLTKLGEFVGNIVSMFLDAGRNAVDLLLKTIIPFMAFVSILVATVEYTGLGQTIANYLSPLGSSLWGLLLISLICSFPLLSPLLGPGAAVAQVVGVLVGTQIAAGAIPPQFALPALFAINAQVGGDFFPVGMSMMNAKPETIRYGTPAFLIARQITGPLAVVIAYAISIGLYS